MKIGIIGSGHIGGTLARKLSGLGHQVSIANSRGPESLRDLQAETGVTPADIGEVAQGAELVVVTIPREGGSGVAGRSVRRGGRRARCR